MNMPGSHDPRPEWRGGPAAVPQPYAHPHQAAPHQAAGFEQMRASWLDECRSRMRGHGTAATGAVIGGLAGGIIGHEVAGRGDKTLGTIAGAAVGAVAGGAIGSAADRSRARDYCENYFDYYTQSQAQPGYGYGYGQGYGHYQQAMMPMTVMVPVAMVARPAPAPQRECKETVVTEEWVPVQTRARVIAPKRRVVPDKRVRIVPDKRVRAY